MRSIATVSAVPATTNGHLSIPLARQILDAAPRSVRGNRIAIDKIYLYHLYAELAQKRATFYVQINNMRAKDYEAFQLDFRRVGFMTTLVRNTVYKAALRDSINAAAIYESTSSRLSESDIEKLKHMFVGPTSVVSINDPEIDTVHLLATFIKTVEKHSAKLLVVGAKLDGMALSHDEIKNISRDYPMGLKGLHAQIVGLLDGSRRGVVDLLESGGKSIVAMLEQRGRDMDASTLSESSGEKK